MTKAKPKKPLPEHPPFQLREFSSNVLSRDWADTDKLNDKLRDEAWRKRALDPVGLYKSNSAGTWHSKDNALTTMGDAGLKLQQMFAIGFAEWGGTYNLKEALGIRTQGWVMIYGDRGYATVHTHPNCHVSAVYYVDDTSGGDEIIMATGVRVRPGDIEFINPLDREFSHPLIHFNPPMILSFKRGRMVIFPSNLPHFVHPIVGPGERIAIACNGTFMPPDTPKDK